MVRRPFRPMSSPRGTSEEALVAACQRGERWAQRELFEQHNAAVFRALLAISAGSDVAEDFLQETFLKAYRAIGSFRGRSSVRTWLVRIGTNTFYEHRRGEQTRRRYISRIESEASGTSLRVVARADDEDGRRGEFRDLALRGLAALRVTDRIVLTLHDIEGYRYAEIAEILDIAPGTVGSRLSRARQRLAGKIRDLLGLDAEESLTAEHLYGHGRRGSGVQGRDCDEPLRNDKDS